MASSKLSSTYSTFLAPGVPLSALTLILLFDTLAIAVSVSAKYADAMNNKQTSTYLLWAFLLAWALQAVAIGLVSYEDLKYIYDTVHKANDVLRERFRRAGISLVDFKMEFGRLPDGRLIVSDELSPDRCRLWDIETGEQFDKDRFRHDLGDIYQGYETVLNRLEQTQA